jgi:hypothetical protein
MSLLPAAQAHVTRRLPSQDWPGAPTRPASTHCSGRLRGRSSRLAGDGCADGFARSGGYVHGWLSRRPGEAAQGGHAGPHTQLARLAAGHRLSATPRCPRGTTQRDPEPRPKVSARLRGAALVRWAQFFCPRAPSAACPVSGAPLQPCAPSAARLASCAPCFLRALLPARAASCAPCLLRALPSACAAPARAASRAKRFGRAEPPGHVKRSGRAEPPGRVKRFGRAEPPGRVKRFGRAEPPGRVKRFGRAEPPGRVKRFGRAEPPGRVKRSGRAEPPGRVKRVGRAKPPGRAKRSGRAEPPGRPAPRAFACEVARRLLAAQPRFARCRRTPGRAGGLSCCSPSGWVGLSAGTRSGSGPGRPSGRRGG